MGHGAGDDVCHANCGLSELHHAGKCFLGYCVISDVCYCLGLDHDLFSQIAFRRSLSKDQVKALDFPLRGGTFTSVLAIIFLVFIIGLIGWFPTTRISLYVGLVWIVLLLVGYYFKVKYQKNRLR